jgi:hypothetical protein
MGMERFNLKKLNEGKLKNNIRLQSQASLQLWKTLRIMGDINRAWDTIREHQNFGPRESQLL